MVLLYGIQQHQFLGVSMTYSTFNRNQVNALTQPMFMGESVNVARYDEQKHAVFEALIEKQLSFFGDLKRSTFLVMRLISKKCLTRKSISSFLT